MKRALAISVLVVILLFFIPVKAAGNLYYVSPTGSDSNPGTQSSPFKTIQKGIDSMVGGDTVYIRGGTYNQTANFVYKTSNGQYMTLANYSGETVILDGSGISRDGYNQPGLVQINHTNYVRITGLHIQNVNMAGIYAAYSDRVWIDHNYTYDTVSTGIGVWTSTHVLVSANDIALAENAHAGYPQSGENFLKLYGVRGFEVKNNFIHKASNVVDGTGGEGLNIEASRDGTVHHNTVRMDERSDGQGPNKFAYAVDAWDGFDNSGTPIVTGNIDVYDNIAYNSRYGFIVTSEEGGTVDGVRFFNNIAYNIGTLDNCYNGGAAYAVKAWGGTVDGPKKNIQFTNNTAFNSCFGFQNDSPQTGNANILVRNNIFYTNQTAAISLLSGTEGQFTLDHNFVNDPKFVNLSAHDFHLQPGSPAIDTGSADGAPIVDYGGASRPQGNGFDIGAYEYIVSAPANTATYTPKPTATKTPAPTATRTNVPTTVPTSVPSQTCYNGTLDNGKRFTMCIQN